MASNARRWYFHVRHGIENARHWKWSCGSQCCHVLMQGTWSHIIVDSQAYVVLGTGSGGSPCKANLGWPTDRMAAISTLSIWRLPPCTAQWHVWNEGTGDGKYTVVKVHLEANVDSKICKIVVKVELEVNVYTEIHSFKVIEIYTFAFKKIHLKMLSGKW